MKRARAASDRRVYLDYHASTPCDPLVVEAMLPYFVEHYANPSSSQHRYGRDAATAVAVGREKLGAAIGAASQEVVFTSGATESNNLAVLGFARANAAERREIVVSAIEHKCVLAAAESLRTAGFHVLIAPVDAQGIVDLGWLIDQLATRPHS